MFNGSVNCKPAQMLGRRSFRAREKFFLLHVMSLKWTQDTFSNPEVGRGFRWREITLQHTVLHFQPHILKDGGKTSWLLFQLSCSTFNPTFTCANICNVPSWGEARMAERDSPSTTPTSHTNVSIFPCLSTSSKL